MSGRHFSGRQVNKNIAKGKKKKKTRVFDEKF